MGAMGPQAAPPLAGTGAVDAVACAAEPGDAAALAASGAPTMQPDATAVAWWLLPRPSRWVDPATGLTVQVDRTAQRPLVDHHARDH
jgi:hypothetical protein